MEPFQVNALRNFYTKLRGGDEQALTRRMLDELGVTLQCHLPDLERVPKTEAAVIVCNHPYRMLEGNKLLVEITELNNICIWVDPIADRSQAARFNSQGLPECLAWLKKGGLLVMFPAGEVSTIDFRRRGIVDPAWIPSATWLARKCGAVTIMLLEWEIDSLAQLARDPEALGAPIADIEPDGKGLPVLLRHYCKLGAKLLQFSVDAVCKRVGRDDSGRPASERQSAVGARHG